MTINDVDEEEGIYDDPTGNSLVLYDNPGSSAYNVVNTTLPDGSIRYTIAHNTSKLNLPIPKAVILDPYYKWNGYPKVSIEFKKFSDNNNLTSIYKALDFIEADYQYREIDLDFNISIEIVRINNNSINAIAYLSNLYEPYSKELSSLFKASLDPMIYWVFEKNYPTLAQDTALKLAHLTSADNDEIILIPPIEPLIEGVNGTCLVAQLPQIESVLQEYAFQLDKFRRESNILFRYKQAKQIYSNWTEFQKNLFYSAALTAKINELRNEFLSSASEEKILAEKKRIAYEKSLHVFDNQEQCLSYLFHKHKNIEPYFNEFSKEILNEWKFLKSKKLEFYDNSAKNTKDLSTLVGTVVFDFASGIISPKIAQIISVVLPAVKALSSTYTLISRNEILDLSNKKNLDKINPEKFINEFTCKVTVCNADYFLNLNNGSREKLAKIFAKYLFTAAIEDKDVHVDASHFIDLQIERMSNKVSVSNIKLGAELLHLRLYFNNESSISYFDYVSNHAQEECHHRLLVNALENSELPGQISDLNSNDFNQTISSD